MIYKYDICKFISYLVYRKEQSKIRGKMREKIGRKYDQISQNIKKVLLFINLSKLSTLRSFSMSIA